MQQYFECANCGQAVKGFHAAEAVTCCDHKALFEVDNGGQRLSRQEFYDAEWSAFQSRQKAKRQQEH